MSRRKAAATVTVTPEAPAAADLRLAPAAPPPAAALAAAPRRAPARRVSAEVVKAETRLIALERRRAESLEHHERSWAQKRAVLLASLPADVRAALEAMGVIEKTKTNGAAAPAREENEAAVPPPAASAPSAAPEDLPALVNVERLAQMLGEVDEAWADQAHPDKLIVPWNEAQRRSAYAWADAVLSDGDYRAQANRPEHTLIGRRHGGNG